jgi:hypothetical protein
MILLGTRKKNHYLSRDSHSFFHKKIYILILLLVTVTTNFLTFQVRNPISITIISNIKKLHGLSPRANYTERATAAFQRSDCQLLRTEGATWSA